MKKLKVSALAGLAAFAVMVAPAAAEAEDISGTILRTLILSENTRLVGDVTCNVTGGPCIAFGAPNIALLLNGFTITGPADPATGCGGTSVATDIGISTNGQSNVGIRARCGSTLQSRRDSLHGERQGLGPGCHHDHQLHVRHSGQPDVV